MPKINYKQIEVLKKLTEQNLPSGFSPERIMEIAEFSSALKKEYAILIDIRQRIIDANGGKMFMHEFERKMIEGKIYEKEIEMPDLTPFSAVEISQMNFTGDDLAILKDLGLLTLKNNEVKK